MSSCATFRPAGDSDSDDDDDDFGGDWSGDAASAAEAVGGHNNGHDGAAREKKIAEWRVDVFGEGYRKPARPMPTLEQGGNSIVFKIFGPKLGRIIAPYF